MSEPATDRIEAQPRGDDPIAAWLIDEAWRLEGTAALIEGLSERFVAGGIPLWRLNYLMTTLHPSLLGSRFLWRRGGDGVHTSEAPRAVIDSEEYVHSPIPTVVESRTTLRRRLVGPKAKLDFPMLVKMRADGGTDYLCVPVEFSDGHVNTVSVASDAERGFSRRDLDRMFAVLPLFARIVEVHAVRRIATDLLDIYVGHDAGGRILKGQIGRGDGQTIRAAIWTCDLRGFTPLADTLSGDALIAILNDYFDRMVEPVAAHGGEVLKFIGDSVLAMFPVLDGRAAAAVCGAALDAALEAAAGMAELNRTRRAAGVPVLRFGLGLHIGDVIYGNIGAASRLDFTVIGPAVNLVNCLEHLSRVLDRPIVASAAVARCLPGRLESMGTHELKGVREPHEVFSVPVLQALPAVPARPRASVPPSLDGASD